MHEKGEKKEKEKGKRIRRALVRHPGSMLALSPRRRLKNYGGTIKKLL
jgi:hypothetical protein